MKNKNVVACAVFVGIVLNIVLSMVAVPFASQDEVKPPNGADNLPFFSQIMHMLVHHNQVLLSSSVVVGLLVGLSCWTACNYC